MRYTKKFSSVAAEEVKARESIRKMFHKDIKSDKIFKRIIKKQATAISEAEHALRLARLSRAGLSAQASRILQVNNLLPVSMVVLNNAVIGKTVANAESELKKMGYEMRVVMDDGERLVVTEDLHNRRANVEKLNNTIMRVIDVR
jgi:hypothetical protein